jgi:hypothetical protein
MVSSVDSMPSDLDNQLDRVKCNDDGFCSDPTNSRFSCYFDEGAGKVVCGIDLVNNQPHTKVNAINQKPPTVDIS